MLYLRRGVLELLPQKLIEQLAISFQKIKSTEFQVLLADSYGLAHTELKDRPQREQQNSGVCTK
ncbi:MAG: hypothetical protein V7L00_11265 [Nostoc sp.]|uniref:hypothetical protein n=1 Tax=Nostoc sp. TaxID=1180 RepID=UPI002FF588B5